MSNQDFFNESSEQSRVKAAIVAKYFYAWANVIMPTVKKDDRHIAYIDLFAGPGRYEDGTKSTPLLVLEKAIQNPEMTQRLVTIFNDLNKDNTFSLEKAIQELPNIQKLKYQPQIHNYEVGNEIVAIFERMTLIPTLFFVDPWGYKGLSLRLINSVLKNWGCDCIFFFNYNRINMGLNNVFVKQHIDALFGEQRADELRKKLETLSSDERELTIVEEIAQALKEMGGKYVLPFRFKNEQNSRTSHHLIFVSKHFKGYDIMKNVMAKESSSSEQGVASFEYTPATENQQLLFELFRPRPLDELKTQLLQVFSGKSLTMWKIYETHSVDTPYTSTNYKEALKALEAEGLIEANPPAKDRRKDSFADRVMVRFK
ncbi:MAG: three-Cys-motif partner protein TcmP [Anaerolineae bacterium]|jgi:three-Cys-motif partner protein|nr:three-Cys-motif partner protein TcmP [Anaerolineae bacterium]